MAYFERDYIEIKRDNGVMEIVGTRREGIEKEEVARFFRARLFGMLPVLLFLWALAAAPVVLDILFSHEHRAGGFTIGATVFLSVFAIVPTLVVIKKSMATRARLGLAKPASSEPRPVDAHDALDWKLRKKYKLGRAHDMVCFESAWNDSPRFIGFVGSEDEAEALVRFARRTAAPQVVDLRTDAERAIENSAGSALAPEHEQLARDMVQFLKTHDTGNNMAHYNAFRETFHARSEAIAKGGGYHQALQEIYYRVRQLCGEQGVYFHAGAVENVFNGEYWRS